MRLDTWCFVQEEKQQDKNEALANVWAGAWDLEDDSLAPAPIATPAQPSAPAPTTKAVGKRTMNLTCAKCGSSSKDWFDVKCRSFSRRCVTCCFGLLFLHLQSDPLARTASGVFTLPKECRWKMHASAA